MRQAIKAEMCPDKGQARGSSSSNFRSGRSDDLATGTVSRRPNFVAALLNETEITLKTQGIWGAYRLRALFKTQPDGPKAPI